MTGDLAARWVRTVVPSWLYRWLMPVVWLAAVVASLLPDLGRCSAEDPTVCGPDPLTALVITLLLSSVVLLWWHPLVAAAAGVLFMIGELLYDDIRSTQIAWAVYGVACAALLLRMVTSRRNQRSIAASAPRHHVQVPPAARIGVTSRLLVAGALVLIGAVAVGWMNRQDQREDEHVRRSVEQTAVVKSHTDDGELVLQLPDGRTHTVSPLDDYDDGAQLPVRVDPQDGSWLRLRAEPADNTHWLGVASGVWLLALLFLLRDLRLRRAHPRRAWRGPALPVRIEPDASSAFAVSSADGRVLLGFLDAALDDEESESRLFDAVDALGEEADQAPAKLKREWEETLHRYRGDALLVGDLAEGSWPTIVFGDQILRPLSPFRAPRRLPWRAERVVGLPEDFEPDEDVPATRSVEAAREVPRLPWEVPLRARPQWALPALIAVVVVVPVAVGTFAVWGDWFAAILATGVGAQLVQTFGSRAFYRVMASATDLWIRTGWSERRVPWRSVDAVEIEEDGLSLEAGEDWHVVGGIPEQQLPEVAAVFETLRLRSRTGLPDQTVGRRLSPVLLINAALVAVCVLILVLARWSPF
ncbi:hypothetical protein [Kribbella shirazensis]|uniref:Uncharacterized protein n=1 Tax=Kribbella shirazensis TaxID=1105143 RepID=A0A7X5V8D2_9ACTN|nr:hypothetical protein [Kribbella shirazensis]NIK56520.1 hypothetical protein [Kribbella shirazensis]